MMYRLLSLTVAFCFVVFSAASATAGGGTFKGKFVYGGPAPTPDEIAVTADKAFCGKHGLTDNSVVVSKDGELKNVIVYLYLKRGDTVNVDPAYDELKEQKVRLDNKDCQFEPHVALLWTEQSIVLGNKDPIGHNTKIDSFNKPINPLIPAGGELEVKFEKPERLPVQVGCNIHPWMRAWLVVRDNPYFAVTDEKGAFEIKHIPAGDWQFQIWHEGVGYVREVEIDGKEVEWSRGRVDVSIEDGGVVDLGEVTVPAEAFED